MFSMTTMASSIRMPMLSVRASIVMLLNVKPMACTMAECGDDRGRQRDGADDRGAPVVQEEQDDEHGQDGAEEQIELHVVDRRGDEEELSMGMPTVTPLAAGFERLSSALTLRATSTVFAPDCLRMTSETAADRPHSTTSGLFFAVLDAGDVGDADRGTRPRPSG
jgi:hypothetical protein